jgi:hypothetical protein
MLIETEVCTCTIGVEGRKEGRKKERKNGSGFEGEKYLCCKRKRCLLTILFMRKGK